MRRSDDAQILPRPAIFAKPALITALAAWSVLAPTNAFADACAQPPASLVSWWSGDGHFYDLAGANHASSLTEVRFATGKVGLAGRFQGPGLGHCTRLPRSPVRHQRPDDRGLDQSAKCTGHDKLKLILRDTEVSLNGVGASGSQYDGVKAENNGLVELENCVVARNGGSGLNQVLEW